MSEKFTCPRREAEGHADAGSPLVYDGPMRDEWREDGTCSYDGSFSGEKFLEYVQAGLTVGSTDKSYKFYMDDWNDKVRGAAKFYTHHLTEEQGQEFARLRYLNKVNFGAFPPYVPLYIPGISNLAPEEREALFDSWDNNSEENK